jgi:hypothetical protein
VLWGVLLKTTALRCFQIHYAVSIMSDEVTLSSASGVDLAAVSHHSTKSSPATGGSAVADPGQHLIPD